MAFFAAKISKVNVNKKLNHDTRYYKVQGPLFFASVTDFLLQIDFHDSVNSVEIYLSESHIWNDSAVGALDKIKTKFKANNITVRFKGMNRESTQIVQ